VSVSSRSLALALRLAPLAAALSLAGCKKPEASAATRTDAAPIKVATFAVEERAMPRFLAVTGSLKADLETDVAADSMGKVVQTFVERGQAVKAGDPLVALDTRASSLTAQQAKENLKLAKENAELAKHECARGKQLLESGTIPQAEYDRRFTTCAVTSAQVEAATASDQLARKNVADAIVRAPFAGVVGERFVNLGQVTQASTRVASIYKVDPLRLQMTVPEADLGQVRPGQEVEFRVAAWEQIFKGTVKYISPNVRAVSRDLVIEAVVPNPKLDGAVLLRPGMFVSARLWIGETPMAVVPRAALRKGEVASSVFQVTNGKIFERIVRLGEERDGLVALLSGAKKGDRLVAAPDEKTRDGVLVAE
jgi:RND family efflux transporter MFP subunit